MRNPKNRILIAIVVLVLTVMACVSGGGGSGDYNTNPGVKNSLLGAPDATATYGAQQLKIQLTAVANPDQP